MSFLSSITKRLALFTALLFLTGNIFAQGITWGTNFIISADSDVFTDGTLLYAYDWANVNATVNGIAFTGTSSVNAGANVSISGLGNNYTGFSSGSAPFSNLSAVYQSVLKGGEYANGNVTVTVTLKNLTSGHVYAVQIWVSDPRASGGEAGRTENAIGTNQVTLAYNVPPTPGGVGEYSIGVFTATATSQTFTLLSNGSSGSTQLNALLVSDVTATGYQPVNPEPPGGPPPLTAQWVHFGANGTLVYYSDNLGNRLPDFSYAGYMGGGVPLPVLPVKITLSPIAGDNTANIQNAINSVSALTPDASGFRGAVLLNPGIYQIAGTLSISASGVVLRGSGDSINNGTVLLVTGTSRNVITVGGTGSWVKTGSTYNITNAYVPLGATNFSVSGSLPFTVGENIVIQRPQTQPWINAINMNSLTNPWTPNSGLHFERKIIAINGSQITVDAPLCNPIESAWTTGQVYQATDSGRIQNVGIENLCGVGQISDYPSNILTGTFISYQNIKNSWAHDILMSGWGNGFSLNDKWCTVQDCIYTNPATGTSSAAPAAYTFGGGAALSLFQRCTSYGGYYHIMVTQAATPGPDVFLNFNCFGTHYNGGPHQRWAAGALHDNIIMALDSEGGYTPYLAINNRGNDGSGQGWSAGFSIMYNCQVPQFQLEQPNTTTNQYNWTIGGIGSTQSYSDEGVYDALGTIVSPHSLYLEQLKERLGPAAVLNIGYQVFTLGATPSTQSVAQGNNISFTVNITPNNYFNDTVTLSVAGLPAGASATFNSNSVAGTWASALTIVASNSVAPANYPLAIQAVDENLTNSAKVNLSVVALTPPTFGPLQFSENNLVFSGANGPANGTYYVLTTTNLALPASQWTILSTNTFDAAGGFSFTNPVTSSQQYFLLRVP
jgi:hypothetical protein